MNWIILYLIIAVISCIVSALLTKLAHPLSRKLNFLDVPMQQGHKLHDRATPLLGGAAMCVSWVLIIAGGVLAAFVFQERLPETIQSHIPGMRGSLKLLAVIAGGAVAICIMGMIDDKKPMGWKFKLSLQTLICIIVIVVDSYYSKRIRISLFNEMEIFTWGITLCWFLFIINAFNFFDNMDGLAAGVAMIASGLFGVIAAIQAQHFVGALAACTCGVSLGYYFYNKFPASIFMGDSGSHFLGYLLAIQGSMTLYYTEDSTTIAPVFIPLLILALPIFDTFAVSAIRISIGKPIWEGDHNHISHRFLKMGVSKRTAVLLVHLLSLALGLSAILLLFLDWRGVIVIFLQIMVILLIISILHSKKAGVTNGE